MIDLKRKKKLDAFDKLLTIMDELRAQCPWDKKQTLESLRHLTIEETYELSDAILEGDLPEIKKELGDILLHLVFYAKIGDEKKAFDMADVIESLNEKLIYRHPHIYGDVEANDEETVKRNWEKLKLKEKGNTSVLGGVPKSLPAMVKSIRIQDKARGVGFDWDEASQVWDKVREEIGEFEELYEKEGSSKDDIKDEFGDMLFSMVNFSRFIDIDPEEALERTNKKFIKRFQYIEGKVREKGLQIEDMSLVELDKIWDEAKRQ